MKIHTNIKPFTCDYPNCEYRSRSKHNLMTHKLSIHNNERQLKRTFTGCGLTFKIENTLTTHLKLHEFGPQLKCDFPNCKYLTTNMFCLRRHKMKNTYE